MGRDFFALYLFDSEGEFLSAHIEETLPRDQLKMSSFPPSNRLPIDHITQQPDALDAAQTLLAQQQAILATLGRIRFRQIRIVPFQTEFDGITFGLVLNEPQEDDEDWWITAEPGDYMAFYPPWSSGEYDT